MAIKDLLEEIKGEVADVHVTGFDYLRTGLVPNRSDPQLTFERNVNKKGKILTSCVLYVDIRNSVALTEKHHTQTMGRIYTAFSKAILKAAKYHSGHIRNIIGDRIMIVFPSKDCFTNAVDCAISINHISNNIVKPLFKDVDFKCGIGIDYGDLRVIKVGIQRKGQENAENRSLVWVGYPANIASRLTDVANKIVTETYYEVQRNPINRYALGLPQYPYSALFRSISPPPTTNLYLPTIETVEMSTEEFASNISILENGHLFMLGGRLIRFAKMERKKTYSEILMTEAVYNGFKSNNPQRLSITKNHWVEQSTDISNVSGKIYGGNVTWEIT